MGSTYTCPNNRFNVCLHADLGFDNTTDLNNNFPF